MMARAPVSTRARPRTGGARPFAFPEVARHALPSGIDLLACDLPGRGILSVRLVLEGGAVQEAAGQAGLAALTAAALLEGTRDHDAAGFGEAVEGLGGAIGAAASWASLRVNASAPTARVEPLAALLGEVIARPLFPDDGIERLRDEQVNQLEMSRRDPPSRAFDTLMEAVYTEDSPYRRPRNGTPETVATLTAADVRDHWRRLCSPREATLVVCGDLGGIDLLGIFGRSIQLPDAPAPPIARPLAASRLQGPEVVIVDRPGAPQSAIALGHLGIARDDPDFVAVQLMMQALGGSGMLTTRLNLKIREEKGYTYGCYASMDARRGIGPFSARTTVEGRVTVDAVKEIHGEIDAMFERGVAQAELDVVRNYMLGVWPVRYQSSAAVADAIANLAVHRLPDDYMNTYQAEVRAASVADVNAAAARHLQPSRTATVVVGDAAAVEPWLRGAGLGPVRVTPES